MSQVARPLDRAEVERQVRALLQAELRGELQGERETSPGPAGPPAVHLGYVPAGSGTSGARSGGSSSGDSSPGRSISGRTSPGIVTERELTERLRRGESLDFPTGTRFTPLAQESLDRLRRDRTRGTGPGAAGVRAPASSSASPARSPASPPPAGPSRARDAGPREVVAVGADHGGFALKQELARHLEERGFVVIDCGTDSTASCDYPRFARAVARCIGEGRAAAGVMVDGAGIGSAMAINKLPGVRAAHCHNTLEAENAREHNHAHVVTLGAGIIGPAMARAIVDTFLATPFGGGRHARRVELIEQGAAAAGTVRP